MEPSPGRRVSRLGTTRVAGMIARSMLAGSGLLTYRARCTVPAPAGGRGTGGPGRAVGVADRGRMAANPSGGRGRCASGGYPGRADRVAAITAGAPVPATGSFPLSSFAPVGPQLGRSAYLPPSPGPPCAGASFAPVGPQLGRSAYLPPSPGPPCAGASFAPVGPQLGRSASLPPTPGPPCAGGAPPAGVPPVWAGSWAARAGTPTASKSTIPYRLR